MIAACETTRPPGDPGSGVIPGADGPVRQPEQRAPAVNAASEIISRSDDLIASESLVINGLFRSAWVRQHRRHLSAHLFDSPARRMLAKIALQQADRADGANYAIVEDDAIAESPEQDREIRYEIREALIFDAFPASRVTEALARLIERKRHRDLRRDLDRIAHLERQGHPLTHTDTLELLRPHVEDDDPSPSRKPQTLAEAYRDPADNDTQTTRTGLSWFDQSQPDGAIARGRYIVVAAPPKTGKSAFLQFVTLAALRVNPELNAVWGLGEMSFTTFATRALMMLSGLTTLVLQRQDDDLSPLQLKAKREGVERLHEIGSRLHVVPGPFTTEDVDREVARTGAAWVCVDYLQRVVPSRVDDTRRDQVDGISRRLAEMAISRDATVLAVSNMSGNAADGVASISSAFKESSTIGYDCDAGYLGVVGEDARAAIQTGQDLPERYSVTWRCLGSRHGNPLAIRTDIERFTLRFFGEQFGEHEKIIQQSPALQAYYPKGTAGGGA